MRIFPQDPAIIKLQTWHTSSSLTFLFFCLLNEFAMAGFAVHKLFWIFHTVLINNQAQFSSFPHISLVILAQSYSFLSCKAPWYPFCHSHPQLLTYKVETKSSWLGRNSANCLKTVYLLDWYFKFWFTSDSFLDVFLVVLLPNCSRWAVL